MDLKYSAEDEAFRLRVLLRRGVLELTGERREPGRTGGRPAALYRFRSRRLEITDQFAVLRPPG